MTDTTIVEDTQSIIDEVLQKQQEVVDQTRFRELPRKSLVHAGGVELPERVPVYDKMGRQSMVPTAALAYHLAKTNRAGERVFFRNSPVEFVEKVIDETCEICLPRGIRKKFGSRFDWRGHMDSFHPRELAVIQEEKADARNENGVLGALLTMTPEMRDQVKRLLFGDTETETAGDPVIVKESGVYLSCDQCGYTTEGKTKHEFALALHMKAHEEKADD